MEKTYKVIELRASNFKKLTAVQIRPDGPIVQISGKNGSGKSSTLDALWTALQGPTVAPSVPIRAGEEEATLKLDLGEVKITRKFRMKEDGKLTHSVSVETVDKGKLPSPQAVLDAIIGKLTFDPLAFTRMKPEDQFSTVRALLPDIDFEGIASANKVDFTERTVLNRKAKELRSQIAGIVLPAGAIPKVGDIVELEARLTEALQSNNATAERRARRVAVKDRISSMTAEIERLTAERDALQAQLDAAEELPAEIDVTQLQADLAEARKHRDTTEAFKRRAELEAEADKTEKDAEALTKRMEKRDADKLAAIEKANVGVPGLSFGDGTVLLNDLPFDQASTAQQLRAALAIATALNPQLRVFCIRDGSLLDDEALQWVAEYAAEKDMQVWVERVSNSEGVGFVLEDGHLIGEEPEPAPTLAPVTDDEPGEIF